MSYLGFGAGAALSWAFEANQNANLPAALDRFAFHDTAAGRVAYDLGNIYRALGFGAKQLVGAVLGYAALRLPACAPTRA